MNDAKLSTDEILQDLHIVEFLQGALKFYLRHRNAGDMGMKAIDPYHRFSAAHSYPRYGRGS